jgi:hypothetical protein
MIDEHNLRDTLLAFATENRTNHILIVSLVNELAALRETVRSLDPTFADVMEQRRDEAQERGAEIAQHVLARLDRIIQQVKDGYVC